MQRQQPITIVRQNRAEPPLNAMEKVITRWAASNQRKHTSIRNVLTNPRNRRTESSKTKSEAAIVRTLPRLFCSASWRRLEKMVHPLCDGIKWREV
jgi:hypothetical protein